MHWRSLISPRLDREMGSTLTLTRAKACWLTHSPQPQHNASTGAPASLEQAAALPACSLVDCCKEQAMAAMGGSGDGPGRGRDEEEGGGSSSKRPRLQVITIPDSDDEDEAGGTGVVRKEPPPAAAKKDAVEEERKLPAPAASSSAAAAAASPSLPSHDALAVPGTSTSTSNGSPMARADLPVLPYYLGRVEGIPEKYNEQCLAVSDAIGGDYTKAILSNYMFEWDWLLGQCPRLASAPVLACYGDTCTCQVTNSFTNIVTFKPPIKDKFRYGTHHAKWALLWYAQGVRVMITTANYIQIDWENKTEAVFVQDFPFIPHGQPEDRSEFGRDLRDYLAELNTWQNASPVQPRNAPQFGHPMLRQALQELLRVDFSSAQAVLVASVPGKHERSMGKMDKYGHLRLRRLLEQEPIPADVFLPPAPSADGQQQQWTGGIVSQFSSMGSHAGDGKWVKEEFEPALIAARVPKQPTSPQMRRMRSHVVWPRLADVAGSLEGIAAGGALPCQPNNMYPDRNLSHRGQLASCHLFLQQRLSRFVAGRWGRHRAMPHHKSFLRYALHRDPNSGEQVTRLAYVLVSSHNFSKSAWGTVQKNSSQFLIQSFELGVLFLPSRFPRFCRTFSLTPDHPLLGLTSASHRQVQEGIRGFYSASCEEARRVVPGLLPIPIPYSLPPPPYAATDIPWSNPLHG